MHLPNGRRSGRGDTVGGEQVFAARGIGAIIAPLLASVSVPALAQQVNFNIPAQAAATGIPEFARQAGVQIVSPVAQLGRQRTRAVRGGYSVDAALALLLRGTGLVVVLRRGNVISLALAPNAPRTPSRPPRLPATPSVLPSKAHEASPQSEIIVTGTRIARPEIDSAMPVAVRTVKDARDYGYNSIYDALIQSPAIGPGLGASNSQGEAWDVGVSSINLRNMGVNRSLVLVDGKRWVSSGARTSAVDLNTIPDALIDRIEVVTGGAAAIYGADAVTGAVNIIMKKSITGLHISVTDGISQQGDARQLSASATTGFTFDGGRGSFEVGGTYTGTAPLRYTDRYDNRTGYVTNPANTGPKDGIADNILDGDIRDLKRSSTPTIFYNNQWYILDKSGLVPTAYDYATNSGPLAQGHGGRGATGFENHFLRNKLVLASLYARLGYEFSPALSGSMSFAFGHSYARSPSVFPEVRDDLRPTNWWGGTTGEIATLTNPYLPDSLRQFMLANGLTSIPLNRTYSNLSQPFEIHRRDSVMIGTELGGRLAEGLKWTGFFQYGQVVDHVTTTHMIRHLAWLNARNVIADPISGQPVCADVVARASGCVPFDFFTTDRPSQSFVDYVEADRYEWRKNALFAGGGSISGKAFSLPYGDVSIAAGVEWRREILSTRDDPDTAKLADIIFRPGGDYVLHPRLDATRETAEVYGEVVIPLLREVPFANRLEIEGAYRYSHYSDTPGTGAWKLGGTWSPTPGLTLRGVFSHSIRVPNFGELYSPLVLQTVGITSDPCSGAFLSQGPNRARNCATLLPGLKLPLTYPNTNAPTIFLGGNPDLKPETSNSFTAGAVLQPGFLSGLTITADYWDIKIDQVITALPYTNILNLCVDSETGIQNFYCGLVSRNSAGQITSISAYNYNLAYQHARGIDIGVSYRRNLGPGQLRINFDGTYLLAQTTIGSPGTDAVDFAGQWNFPRFRATSTATYSIGRLSLGLNTRFIGRSVFDVTDASSETRDPSHVPAYVTNDINIQYRLTAKHSLSLGVKNVGNVGIFGPLRDTAPGPNSTGGAQTGAAYLDPVGRYFFVKADLNF